MNEVWNELFPILKGQKVELIQDTQFGDGELLKKGTIGIVVLYRHYSPLITVDFGKEKYYLLERKRVRKVFDV